MTGLVAARGMRGSSAVTEVGAGNDMGPERVAGHGDRDAVAAVLDVARGLAKPPRAHADQRNAITPHPVLARPPRAACGAPAFFDGTHSVQRPGRAAGSSGGDPEFTPPLVRAAVAAGCDGLFLETHPRPLTAPSDASNMLPLDNLEGLLREVLAVRSALFELPASIAP